MRDLCVSVVALLPMVLRAQGLAPARAIGPVVAESREAIGFINSIRVLSNGRVLVNDSQKHRLLLLDSNLTLIAVVADSTLGGTSTHGTSAGSLIAFTADSTLYVDTRSLSLLVLDPAGKISRVMAVPRPADVALLALFVPGFDRQGRLIYRGATPAAAPRQGPDGKWIFPEQQPDSVPLHRVDLATRKLDTVAFHKTTPPRLSWSLSDDGKHMYMDAEVLTVQFTDGWAVMADGTLALVRAQDYHVDWVGPDGGRTSSPKIPFPWERLTDDDKARLIDSVRKAIEAAGPPRDNGGLIQRMNPPTELPDYRPPFRVGVAVMPSKDNTLWVATTARGPSPGTYVYDVIDRSGALVERVVLPTVQRVGGFGPNGSVFLIWRDGMGAHLARAHHSSP